MTDRTAQIDTFLRTAGWSSAARELVAGDASNRRYFRLRKDQQETAILMDAPPDRGEDVLPFVSIARHLRDVGLNAPRIMANDTQAGLLLLEDFGDDLFASLMATDPSQEIPLYRAAADVLIHLQTAPNLGLPVCDKSWLIDMMDPLFEWYAPHVKPIQIEAFQSLFARHADKVIAGGTVMILRDYHAQNLLLVPNRSGLDRVGILDFQDAMLGHPAYDLVSVLQDARREVNAAVEADIMSYFLTRTELDETPFKAAYAVLGLQRNLRILGIFARLCARDSKPQYVDFIPRVWGYVRRNLAHPDLADVAAVLDDMLPPPNDAHLDQLRATCPTPLSQR